MWLAFADRPALVDLTDAEGGTLTIGVGGDVSIALFMANMDPPYLISIGDGQHPLDVAPWFDHGGSESEFEIENSIAPEIGRRVASDFVATGSITAVEWAET